MLFDNYNKITYTFNGKEVILSDIFRNISFDDVETSNAFFEYYIEDGETPESVSIKVYGTSSYSWLILLVNSIADRKNDWFESEKEYVRKKELNYGGNAFYVAALPDLQVGDVMVKVTSTSGNNATDVDETTYRHIAEFDPYFRKIRGICGSGTFAIGDNILFGRKQSNGSVIPLTFDNKEELPETTDFTNIIYLEKYENSVDYFYTANNIVLNPYRAGITGYNVDADTTYTDEGATGNNFAVTLIYKYGACGGIPVSGSIKHEVSETLRTTYLNKQKIKILRPEYLSSVIDLIKTSLSSNEVGKSFKIII